MSSSCCTTEHADLTSGQACATDHADPQDRAPAAVKAAIVVLSDPQSGSDEALGRIFNALAAAYDFKAHGEQVTIQFHGAATRWIGELSNSEHPAHALFEQVKDQVAGVSCGCADVFGGGDEAQQSGFELITDNPIPGTSGLPSLHRLITEGYTLLTF